MRTAQIQTRARNVNRKVAAMAVGVSLLALQGCADTTGYEADAYGYGPYDGYGYPYYGDSYYYGPGWHSYRVPRYRSYRTPETPHRHEDNGRSVTRPPEDAERSIRERPATRDRAHGRTAPKSEPGARGIPSHERPRRSSREPPGADRGHVGKNDRASPRRQEDFRDRNRDRDDDRHRRSNRHGEDKGRGGRDDRNG